MNILENNNVSVTGRLGSTPILDHEAYGEKFYSSNILIERKSKTVDNIPVLISDRVFPISALSEGSVIGINGQYRSHNVMDAEGKNRLKLFIFAIEIYTTIDFAEDKNEAHFIGYVCRKPVCRTTPGGREITDLMIAVNSTYKKSHYIPVIVWGRNAHYAEKFSVGDKVEVYGRLQSREYTKKFDNGDSVDMTAYEMSATRIEVLDYEEN